MRRLCLAISVVGAFALAVTGTIGGAPPVFNEADHPIDASLVPEVGTNCGNGMPTLITGSYSGVIHTLVKPDGTLHINGSVHGAAINDDLPSDGTADATTTFNSNFTDTFRSDGGESHHLVLNGLGTTTETGATFRFHVAIHTLLDQNGNLKVDKLQFRCF